MANNNKYLFAVSVASNRSEIPPNVIQSGGWDPDNGTQVPVGSQMNYMHRQLSLSNDFWYEIPVDLQSGSYSIDEAHNFIGSNLSYPAESLLFSINSRGASPTTNTINIEFTGSAPFGNWPLGRAFWVKNSLPNLAAFVRMPDIAANPPAIPETITNIYKILMPGQYCKFRCVGTNAARLPYLTLEYDSHWIDGQNNILTGASEMSSTSILDEDVINHYYNGGSYCASASIIIDFPNENNINGASYKFLQNYNFDASSLTFPINTISETNNWPTVFWPIAYEQPPGGVLREGLNMIPEIRWYACHAGNPESVTINGLVNMRLDPPPNVWQNRNELSDGLRVQRVISQISSISSGVETSGNNGSPNDTWNGTGFLNGSQLCGFSSTQSKNIMAIGTYSIYSRSFFAPLGRYISKTYLIYPNPVAGSPTAPGYF